MHIVKDDGYLLDMKQAAQYLNIKISTLYSLCMKKMLPVCKIGKLNRFRKQDLDKFISDNMNEVRE